ncbi:MAG TPA: phosphatidate cytidylyltransferase [Candidatus Acidoferrales bacterium]|nr:phosphatidate cytidylyltransferase [Candidatus Acidoferrales bacterium]
MTTVTETSGKEIRPLNARRIGIGILLAVGGVAAVFSKPLYALVVLMIALGSLYEFARLSERRGPVFAYPVAIIAVIAYLTLTYLGEIRRYESVLLVTTVIGALAYATFTERGNYFARSAYTVLGVFYIGKLLSYFIEIRGIPHVGIALSIYAIVLIAMTDVAAMLTGLAIGRTQLTRLSPKKTVEGAIGGLCVAGALGAAGGMISPLHLTWWIGLGIGLITSFAAQAGDLVESALKRDARVKDAGSVIAGHGGVLDRFDSFLFGGIAFYFALWLAGFAVPNLHELLRSAQAPE